MITGITEDDFRTLMETWTKTRLLCVVAIYTILGCSSAVPVDGSDSDINSVDAGIDSDLDSDESTQEYQETRCWTVTSTEENQIALLEFDMSNGAWFEIERYGEGFHSLSPVDLVFWRQTLTIVDLSEPRWIEIDTTYRTIRIAPTQPPMHTIAIFRDHFISYCAYNLLFLCLYRDFDSLVTSAPAEQLPWEFSLQQLEVRDEQALCAHIIEIQDDDGNVIGCDAIINIQSLTDGQIIRSIRADGFQGTFILGLSYSGGRIYLLDDGFRLGERGLQHITAHDPLTGGLLDEIVLSGFPYSAIGGLWCESPGPELP